MAELILTDAEKAAALWSDLDDAALGKLVKRKISLITTTAEQLDSATTFAAAVMLCCAADEHNASRISLEIEGLVLGDGRDLGSWTIVAQRAVL